MSCDELDRLRAESHRSSSVAWPKEALQHLESCERCSQLQAALDTSAPEDVPEFLHRRIEAAILPGLQPVSPLPDERKITLTLFVCSIIVIAAGNLWLGLAGWRARSSLQLSVDFLLLGISILGLANMLAHQMTPGFRRRASVWLYLAVPLPCLLAAVATLFGYRWNPDFVPLAISCWEIGVVCAALAAPLFWIVLRRGLSLDPVGHGTTVGLLAGMVGVTVLEIYCPILDRLHISVSHIGAALTSALVGAAVGGIQKRIRRRTT